MAVMILALATGAGLQRAIEEKVSGFNGHVQILKYNLNASLEQAPITPNLQLLNSLQQDSRVQHLQVFAQKAGILKKGAAFEGLVLKGVNASYNWQFFEGHLQSGRLPQFDAAAPSSDLLISTAIARLLLAEVGDTVAMYFLREAPQPPLQRTFIICGLFNTGLEDFDKSLVVGDLQHVQRLNKWSADQIGGIELLLTKMAAAPQFAQYIRKNLDYDLDAVPIQEAHEQLFQWMRLFDVNILLIIIIVLAVGTINIVVALLILILERTRTIGLLKAMGATHRLVVRVFLFQAVGIVGRGLLWGNLVGLAIAFAQLKFQIIGLDPTVYYVNAIPIHIQPLHILLLNVGTAVFCVMALLVPAQIIARIKPQTAIQFR